MTRGVLFSEVADAYREELGTCHRCHKKFKDEDRVKLLKCHHIFHSNCSTWKCVICSSQIAERTVTNETHSSSISSNWPLVFIFNLCNYQALK